MQLKEFILQKLGWESPEHIYIVMDDGEEHTIFYILKEVLEDIFYNDLEDIDKLEILKTIPSRMWLDEYYPLLSDSMQKLHDQINLLYWEPKGRFWFDGEDNEEKYYLKRVEIKTISWEDLQEINYNLEREEPNYKGIPLVKVEESKLNLSPKDKQPPQKTQEIPNDIEGRTLLSLRKEELLDIEGRIPLYPLVDELLRKQIVDDILLEDGDFDRVYIRKLHYPDHPHIITKLSKCLANYDAQITFKEHLQKANGVYAMITKKD